MCQVQGPKKGKKILHKKETIRMFLLCNKESATLNIIFTPSFAKETTNIIYMYCITMLE